MGMQHFAGKETSEKKPLTKRDIRSKHNSLKQKYPIDKQEIDNLVLSLNLSDSDKSTRNGISLLQKLYYKFNSLINSINLSEKDRYSCEAMLNWIVKENTQIEYLIYLPDIIKTFCQVLYANKNKDLMENLFIEFADYLIILFIKEDYFETFNPARYKNNLVNVKDMEVLICATWYACDDALTAMELFPNMKEKLKKMEANYRAGLNDCYMSSMINKLTSQRINQENTAQKRLSQKNKNIFNVTCVHNQHEVEVFV